MENGTYRARPKTATVEETKSGALMVYIIYAIEGGPEIRGSHCLYSGSNAKNPNMLQTKNVDTLKALYGWDGTLENLCSHFVGADLSGFEVEVEVENKLYNGTNEKYIGKMFPEIKWVNPPGGGGGRGLKMPEEGEKKSILAKFGSKFRAAAGPQPVTRKPPQTPPQGLEDGPAKPATAKPAAPPSRPAMPTVKPVGANMDSVFGRFCELTSFDDKTPADRKTELETIWWGYTDATGKTQDAMTGDDWASVLTAINADSAAGKLLPF
jgi:hypothetical protein